MELWSAQILIQQVIRVLSIVKHSSYDYDRLLPTGAQDKKECIGPYIHIPITWHKDNFILPYQEILEMYEQSIITI